MKKVEVIAIIILIITVVCLIVLPRWYYHAGNPGDTVAIITAIYTAAAVQISLIVGILGGLIISLRK